MILLAVIGVGFVLVAVWAIACFNQLVGLRQQIRESWSNVDTELLRRHDLVPNLVETVKTYARHEQSVLAAVAASRAAVAGPTPMADRANAAPGEAALGRDLARLLAVAEAYPELKADAQFARLQRELVDTEDRLQAARRFFNANVREMNTRVGSVPSNLIANAFGFEREAYFELENSAAAAVPRVSTG